MNKPNMDFLFSPDSVAVVGVSDDWSKFSEGRRYLESFIKSGFKGRIYGVNPKGGEVFGLKLYPSIHDIPDSVDYVIIATPAQSAPQLAAECVSKGVKAIQIYAGGFGEAGDEHGRQLESEIRSVVQRAGIRIIGPNSVGLYCPKTGVSFSIDFPKRSGPVGFIGQSGGNPTYCIREGAKRGLYFSKVIGCGNASDVNETDFMEYLALDPETRIIAAYIEGVKNAPRFAAAVKQAAKRKPVIIFKGGATEAGARAAASHTAASPLLKSAWDRILKETGAIQVNSVEEIVDVALLFRFMSVPEGKRTAIIGAGGAATVKAADDFTNAGLTVPPLQPETRQKIEAIQPTKAGRIFGNPIDINFPHPEILFRTAKTIADSEVFDLLVMHMGFDSWGLTTSTERKDLLEPCIDAIIRIKDAINKPVAVVLHSYVTPKGMQFASTANRKLIKAGIPVYPTFPSAACAIDRFIQYHQWLGNIQK